MGLIARSNKGRHSVTIGHAPPFPWTSGVLSGRRSFFFYWDTLDLVTGSIASPSQRPATSGERGDFCDDILNVECDRLSEMDEGPPRIWSRREDKWNSFLYHIGSRPY